MSFEWDSNLNLDTFANVLTRKNLDPRCEITNKKKKKTDDRESSLKEPEKFNGSWEFDKKKEIQLSLICVQFNFSLIYIQKKK